MRSIMAVSLLAAMSVAQDRAEASFPRFDVAAVKPWSGREVGGTYTYPGGRVAFRGCTVVQLIQLAFALQDHQISGATGWMTAERFDIDATVPATPESSTAQPPTVRSPLNDEQRRMLQALLVERFGLSYRRETSEGPVFLLTRNGKALKMTEAKDKSAFPWAGGLGGGRISGDGLRGINESMADLALRLGPYMGRSVVDRTGLAGSFDFETRYAGEVSVARGAARPGAGGPGGVSSDGLVGMIVTSLNDLGLSLEPSRGEVTKLVIEKAQRPSDN